MQTLTINDLEIKQLIIPFKVAFKHASATRNETSSIFVRVRSTSGTTGFGEGCPRRYVTNETLHSAYRFIQGISASIMRNIHDLDTLQVWMRKNSVNIDTNPTAWCALEMAVLDLLAKENNEPVESLLSLPDITGIFHYSAVLGDGSVEVFKSQLKQYQSMGLIDYKIKISGDLEKDQEKLNFLKGENIPPSKIRLDANNLWLDSRTSIAYLSALNGQFWAIEEPLKVNQHKELRHIHDALNIKIILDESFIKIEQFVTLQERPEIWIINARVSKFGGLLRSLAIAQQARMLDINLIIGAQVGETSLLTRAALTIAHASKDMTITLEGAFGTRLLAEDICEPSIMFEQGGILDMEKHMFHGLPGLGLDVSPSLAKFIQDF